MRLRPYHVFFLLLALFLLSNLGMGVKEYFENKDNTSHSSNGLSNGIPKSQIPPGDEHLYIKKSEIVPPICPKCPDVNVCDKDHTIASKCPPCPPCARCPEPAFECKKVPNYKLAGDQGYLPRPVLADFSQFGM